MSTVIGFDRPVERQLVHRASTAEVFPTDFHRTHENTFLAGLQWPRGHGFYRLVPLDSALIVESIRQLTILAVHLGYGVPAGLRFVMPALGFRVWSELHIEPGQALEVSAHLSGMNVRRTRTGELRSARIHVELAHGGATIASGFGDAMTLTLAEYSRIRGPHLDARPAPVERPMGPPPAQVGRLAERDVTLRHGLRGLEVVADPTNPVLFDHLVDHVPGAALIEACLQAVRLRTGAFETDFAEFEATFHRMVEFDAPNTLQTSIGEECQITVKQADTSCVEARGRLRSV